MTLIGTTAVLAGLVAGGYSMDSPRDAMTPDDRFGEARVIDARVGWFRRDLGNDPAYSNFQHYDPNKPHSSTPRGFRSYGNPQNNEAGIYLYYEGGHTYIQRNGFRRDPHDPGLRGK